MGLCLLHVLLFQSLCLVSLFLKTASLPFHLEGSLVKLSDRLLCLRHLRLSFALSVTHFVNLSELRLFIKSIIIHLELFSFD